MEKFGLFDLIEKFNASAQNTNSTKKSEAGSGKTPEKTATENIVGAPPQLVMNAKMREFLARHDTAVAEIRKQKAKKRGRKNKGQPSKKPKVDLAPPKRGRGRPKKAAEKQKNPSKNDL